MVSAPEQRLLFRLPAISLVQTGQSRVSLMRSRAFLREQQMQDYTVRRTPVVPALAGAWDSAAWETAETLPIAVFRPESTDHRPETSARLLYDADRIYGIFRVRDRYVRCIHTEFQGNVCRDSCVEFFFEPAGAGGYFNFEFNCGGTMLCSYVVDPTRDETGIKDLRKLGAEAQRDVEIYHSLPVRVEPEVAEETVWFLEFAIPFALLADYTGLSAPVAGDQWRANLYKCGDATSHPHWASWVPVSEKNFHLPQCFGTIVFGG